MFDADRPITSSTQDRLDRTLFAKYLARCMLDHQDPESLVVGLYGGWGVGKTSIINLVVEELNFAASNMPDAEKPIVLNFSVWSYSGHGELVYSFFRRLSSALRSVEYLENANRIIHLLELYVSFFTKKPVPRALRTKRSLWHKLTFQGREEVYAWESGRDLTLVKAELNQLLKNQKHKIIIMIDNISRLYDYEIKEIFQIVKSMGDYANTAYMLAFDKDEVVHKINKIDGGGGNEYIEKIVQLPFAIPPISPKDIEYIFADRISDVMATVPEDAWNAEYWADIYYSSLRAFFQNCRDITRYVNTLNFSYPRLRDVVNPVDFFALTAIEVFLPAVYSGIRENKDLFTDLLDNVYKPDEDRLEKDRSRCNEIINRSKRFSRELILELLIRLFPRLRKLYQPDVQFYHSDAATRKLRRICSPDLFEVYFRLSMQTSHIPQSEFDTILKVASDESAFDQALTRLNQDERIDKFLDQLDSNALEKIPQDNIKFVITALINNGDLFPQGMSGLLRLDTPMRIHRIVHRLLQRFNNNEDRFSILQSAIAKANKSIYIILHELLEQERQHTEEEDTFLPIEFRDLTPTQLDSLKVLAIARIDIWARNGNLVEHPKLLPILYVWRNWGDEIECRRYVEEITKTDRGLVVFLVATLDEAIKQAMTIYEKNSSWEQYLQNIEAFIPVKMLEQHAREIFEDTYFEKLREREQLAVMIFLDLTKTPTKKQIPKTTV